jgi:phage I-like protein
MDLNTLLEMLGCSSPAEAAAAVTRFNAFLAAAKATSGADDTDGILASMRNQSAFMVQVLDATGCKDLASALGKIEAMKATADRVAAVEKERDELRASALAAEATGMIDGAVTSGKLTPAHREKAQTFFAKHGLDGLKAFLDALPPAAVTPAATAPVQPAVRDDASATSASAGTGDTDVLSAEEKNVAELLGLSEEDMEKANALWKRTEKPSLVNRGTASEYSFADFKALNKKSPVTGLHILIGKGA